MNRYEELDSQVLCLYLGSLYLITLGVVMIVRSSLGTSPISSLAYVMSLNSFLTLGSP